MGKSEKVKRNEIFYPGQIGADDYMRLCGIGPSHRKRGVVKPETRRKIDLEKLENRNLSRY